jgi:hypothetical protein
MKPHPKPLVAAIEGTMCERKMVSIKSQVSKHQSVPGNDVNPTKKFDGDLVIMKILHSTLVT